MVDTHHGPNRHQKNAPPLPQPKRASLSEESEAEADAEDAATIFAEVGHMRDRDEIVSDGNRSIHGGPISSMDDSWEGDQEEEMLGDRIGAEDAVTELESVSQIHENELRPRESELAMRATPAAGRESFEMLSDEELMARADALSIPDRQNMPRFTLIERIKRFEMGE